MIVFLIEWSLSLVNYNFLLMFVSWYTHSRTEALDLRKIKMKHKSSDAIILLMDVLLRVRNKKWTHATRWLNIRSKNSNFGFKLEFTVFENYRKSLIQHCERSELRLHFEWTIVIQKCQKWFILVSFWKLKAFGQTELPDRSVLIGQKLPILASF